MSHSRAPLLAAAVALLVGGLAYYSAGRGGSVAQGEAPPPAPVASAQPVVAASSDEALKYRTEWLRGKVVWLADALQRVYGVTTEADAAKSSVVLEMADGTLWPIMPDTRGQAFVVDERLRNLELQVLVRRYEKAPLIQVIRVLRPDPAGTMEIDYWCDVCAIPMYILKPCECCQGETRLREQPVEAPPEQ